MAKCDIGKLKKHGGILERRDPPGIYITYFPLNLSYYLRYLLFVNHVLFVVLFF